MENNLAYINYKLLKKARIHRRMSLRKACNGIIEIEALIKAEKGIEKLRFEEFKLLANRYKMNITYFYLKEEPSIVQRIKWKSSEYKIKLVEFLIRIWKLDDEFSRNL